MKTSHVKFWVLYVLLAAAAVVTDAGGVPSAIWRYLTSWADAALIALEHRVAAVENADRRPKRTVIVIHDAAKRAERKAEFASSCERWYAQQKSMADKIKIAQLAMAKSQNGDYAVYSALLKAKLAVINDKCVKKITADESQPRLRQW